MARCCTSCFRDPILVAFIDANGTVEACEFCDATDSMSADVSTLAEFFEPLLALYEAEPEPNTVPRADPPTVDDIFKSNLRFGRTLSLIPNRTQTPPLLPVGYYEGAKPLPQILHRNWAIFSDAISEQVRQALTGRILEANGQARELAASTWTWMVKPNLVVPRIHTLSWESFAKHLKTERRFIPDTKRSSVDDMRALFSSALGLVEAMVDATSAAYRARRGYSRGQPFIPGTTFMDSGPEPLPVDEMGAPPQDKTTDGGRMNPPGIPFLYLADDERTAVAEIRPAKNDLISVALFTISRDLRIADLTKIKPLETPFGHDDLVNEVEIRRLLEEIGRQLAQPVNPQAGPVEYVPTQFFAEVVRDADFDGIAYPSALGPATNLVLFDPDIAEPQECRLVRVTDVSYSIQSLSLAELAGGGPPLPPLV